MTRATKMIGVCGPLVLALLVTPASAWPLHHRVYYMAPQGGAVMMPGPSSSWITPGASSFAVPAASTQFVAAPSSLITLSSGSYANQSSSAGNAESSSAAVDIISRLLPLFLNSVPTRQDDSDIRREISQIRSELNELSNRVRELRGLNGQMGGSEGRDDLIGLGRGGSGRTRIGNSAASAIEFDIGTDGPAQDALAKAVKEGLKGALEDPEIKGMIKRIANEKLP